MVKRRDIVMAIILTIVTCGIYGIYWFVCMTDDLNTLSEDPNATPGVTAFILTIVTCGIYALYWAFKAGEKIDIIKQRRGIPSSNSGVLYLVLTVFGFGIVSYALIQNEINNVA